MAFFNAEQLPNPKREYVCFLDIMGIQNRMIESIPQTCNMIFKLHSTILTSIRESGYTQMSVYPIMDGAYLSSPRKDDLLRLLTKIYRSLATDFVKTTEAKHNYFIRCSLAYGQVIHGRDIPYSASREFESRVGYKEQIMMGQPVIYANQSEKLSSPFGIYIHDSAKAGGSNRSKGSIDPNWKWYDEVGTIKVDNELIVSLCRKIKEYYIWIQAEIDNNSMNEESYPQNKRDSHLQLVSQYYQEYYNE